MLKSALIFFAFLSFYTCSKKNEQVKNEVKKPEMSIKVKHLAPKTLNKIASKELESWKSHNDLGVFLKRFENTSPNEALSNALELKDLIKKIKENITINELNTPAFRARLNVLENEALRLADMTYIPAITPKEVNTQINKIFLVFSSLNAKINTVYNQKLFNDEIDLNSFFELDSTKITKEKTTKLPKYDD